MSSYYIHTITEHTIQYNTIQYITLHYNTIQYNTLGCMHRYWLMFTAIGTRAKWTVTATQSSRTVVLDKGKRNGGTSSGPSGQSVPNWQWTIRCERSDPFLAEGTLWGCTGHLNCAVGNWAIEVQCWWERTNIGYETEWIDDVSATIGIGNSRTRTTNTSIWRRKKSNEL